MKKLFFTLLVIVSIKIQAQCWLKVETGLDCSFGIKIDSTLWAWGSSLNGQLGNGTFVDENKPVLITNDKWIALSGGYGCTMGIKKDGTLWGWGDNYSGQLGLGTNSVNFNGQPLQVGTDNNWIEVYVYGPTSFGIKNNGTLWGWGENSNGEMGDGTNIDRPTPFQLGTANNWKSLAIGSGGLGFALAIKTDGTLWAWGMNLNGQLGIGNNTNTFVPTQVGNENNWAQVSASYLFSIGLKTNGTLWGWGNNDGNLGTGNTTSVNSPIQIGTDTDWVYVSTMIENRYVIAIKANGTLWAWGNNSNFTYGNGTNISQNVPTLIGSVTNWKSVAISERHVLAIKSDNSLWAWGTNFYGELGDGTNINKYTPNVVTCINNEISETSRTNNLIGLFPNPCSNVLKLNSNQLWDFDLFDFQGRSIKSDKNVSEIDISKLNKGVYFIILTNGEYRFSEKIIKE